MPNHMTQYQRRLTLGMVLTAAIVASFFVVLPARGQGRSSTPGMPTRQPLSSVTHDSTLRGDGTTASPLGVISGGAAGFRHSVDQSNECDGQEFTVLDHPALNGHPEAVVVAQQLTGAVSNMVDNRLSYPGFAFSDCPADRWLIELPSVGMTFNVIVVNP